MRVLIGGDWRSCFLDYHRPQASYRVRVHAWCRLAPITGLYFERTRSLHLILSYLKDVGPRGVIRKIASRQAEVVRNQKFFSIGLGEIAEGPVAGRFRPGERVWFLAPCHPACVERCVVPEFLLRTAYTSVDISDVASAIRHLNAEDSGFVGEAVWGELLGWSPESGIELTRKSVAHVMTRAIELFENASWAGAQSLSLDNASESTERSQVSGPSTRDGKPRGVIFGRGHYVKTVVLPNLRPFLELDEIHEIDPVQIGPVNSVGVVFDTSPELSKIDDHDAVVAAGFHHTHVPLALAALEWGKYAVVEKPLVVDYSQLSALEQALRRSGRKLFAGFQRRYTPMNEWARDDLCVTEGDPLSYRALVYHVPLPPRHWYRWPSAKSRLVSNGCHWIDHFLYLNGYARPTDWNVTVGGDDQINCSVSLENGAFFTLAMTDQGSPRLGVRELVELRTTDGMVRIYDGSRYVAEVGDRVRHRRISKLGPYKTMYGEFGRKIAEGKPADSIESVTVSARLMLDLDAQLRAAIERAAEHP